MKTLTGEEEKQAIEFLHKAAEIARMSTCQRAKCGSIIVKDNQIIGTGYNSPPGNLESQRRCSCNKDSYHKKVTDRTCCIHAEDRAKDDALDNNSDKIHGSRLYFARLDASGQIEKAGMPYCTMCSKKILDAGIAEFVLWHDNGVTVYDTEEYNDLSFAYKE